MNSESVKSEACPRSFRICRSSMTFGRAAFWTAASSYAAAIFFGQLTLAWLCSVIAIFLGMTELLVMRGRSRSRHPGLAVVGLLLGLPIVVSPMLLWPAQ